MIDVQDTYVPVTENSSADMVELNGKFTAVRDGDKWEIKQEIPSFDNLGVLSSYEDIVVGIQNSNFYLIDMSQRPTVIGVVKSYQRYPSNEFVWIYGDTGDISNSLIGALGGYFIHRPSGSYVRTKSPPETKPNETEYMIDDMTEIVWTGRELQRRNLVLEGGSVVQDTRSDDDRMEHLEEYLSDNVQLDIVSGANNMSEVDLTETPEPIVYVFYDLGEGDFPEDQDGDFKPPSQDEFAQKAYERFKRNSDSDGFREENKQAWIKRLKNAWASIVRDLHFSFSMHKENKVDEPFDKVEFDMEKDVEDGVDLLIEDAGQEYHVNLFVDTKKSRKFLREKKQTRHDRREATEIAVPMKLRGGSKKVIDTDGADLFLYDDEHIEAIKQIIKNGESSVVADDGTKLCYTINN